MKSILKSIMLVIGLFVLLILLVNLLVGGPSCPIVDAKLKNLENEFNGISAAIYQYQDKYRALPGDINRNGQIEGAFDSNQTDDESCLVWLHLRQTGLIAGDPHDQQQPRNVFGGLIGIATGISTGQNRGIPGLFIGFTKVPKKYVLMVEQRADDSFPDQGQIQAHYLVSGIAIPVKDYSQEGFYNLYLTL
jgi:hypothetical protein